MNPTLLLAVIESVRGDEVVDFYRMSSSTISTYTIVTLFCVLMILVVMMVLPATL
jgi:hypothetical protein